MKTGVGVETMRSHDAGRGKEGRRERGREEQRLAFLASGYSLLVGWHVWGLKPMIPAP